MNRIAFLHRNSRRLKEFWHNQAPPAGGGFYGLYLFFFFSISFSPKKVSTQSQHLVTSQHRMYMEYRAHGLNRRGRQNFCLQKSRMPLAGLVYFIKDLSGRMLDSMSVQPLLFFHKDPSCTLEDEKVVGPRMWNMLVGQ